MKKTKLRFVSALLVMTMTFGSVVNVSAAAAGAGMEESSDQAASVNAADSETAAAETSAAASDASAESADGSAGTTNENADGTSGASTGSTDSTAGTAAGAANGSADNTAGTAAGATNGSADNTAGAAAGATNGGTDSTAGATNSGTDGSAGAADNSSAASDGKDISGTVTVDKSSDDVSGTVTVEQDKDDDNVEIKKSDKPYLALGADLSEEQRATVLGLMGIDAARLSDYDVVTVNNSEEHQYLDSYIDSSKIGTRSLSSVVIVQRKDGNGINISTNNISYCTVGMYKNALATAGIENADIIVAAPFPISGTAALVGIFKAYKEMTGDEVDEENIDAALNELVVTGALKDAAGGDADEIEELMAYVKQAVVEHDMSDETEIREVIAEACDKFQVTLTEDEVNQIVQLMLKISELDLDIDSLLNAAKSIYDKIGNDSSFWAKLGDMLSSLLDALKSIFK